MYPQQHLPLNKSEPPPGYAVVFIGGFGDVYLGISKRLHDAFEGFLPEIPFHKSFYHWDGHSLGLLHDNHARIASHIAAYQQRYPDIPIILVGHSYGGSASMAVARKLKIHGGNPERLIVLTIDAVSRRQPKTRAQGILFWGNSYLYEGGGLVDIIPRVGGRWGQCQDADIDLSYSGYARGNSGRAFSHREPSPMLYESPDSSLDKSLADHVRSILTFLLQP